MSQLQIDELGRRTSSGPRRDLGGGASIADQSGSGLTLWADSNHPNRGTQSRPGTRDTPYSTVTTALADARLAATDRFAKDCHILVAEGHVEDIAAADGWTMPNDRVSIIGQGFGDQRALISFTTATTASIDIVKLACRLANLRFTTTFDAITDLIDLQAGCAGFILEDCEFKWASTKEPVSVVSVGNAGADNVIIRGNYFRGITAGANHAIGITAIVDDLRILDNFIFGDFANAGIFSDSAHINCEVARNMIVNLQTGDHAIEFSAAATGVIHHNGVNSTLAAAATKTAIDPGSCYCLENYGSDGVGDVSGVLNPVADS